MSMTESKSAAMPLSFKIQIMHDETFKMSYITSLNSNWFQNGQPSKLEEWKNVRFTSKTDVFFIPPTLMAGHFETILSSEM